MYGMLYKREKIYIEIFYGYTQVLWFFESKEVVFRMMFISCMYSALQPKHGLIFIKLVMWVGGGAYFGRPTRIFFSVLFIT